jgi:hypothetical protein
MTWVTPDREVQDVELCSEIFSDVRMVPAGRRVVEGIHARKIYDSCNTPGGEFSMREIDGLVEQYSGGGRSCAGRFSCA